MDDSAIVDVALEDVLPAPPPPPPSARIAYRHRLPTRIWHWVNAITVFVMLMSGLMILNAHARLYWGQFGANSDHAWIDFTVDGLVARPLSIPIETLRSLPHRTQITRHDYVEGWSAIGKWHGVQLSRILDAAGLSTRANYIVFHCADRFGSWPYYEGIDIVDALHPQTILAWGMNGHLLPVPNGAPLRLRVERQLGYKHAKYVRRIEAVESLSDVYRGKGGYWEDSTDYQWYAGI